MLLRGICLCFCLTNQQEISMKRFIKLACLVSSFGFVFAFLDDFFGSNSVNVFFIGGAILLFTIPFAVKGLR